MNTPAPFHYIRAHYHVPAEIGRRVVVNGRPGLITADRGHHLGVTFDEDPPEVVKSVHPTWRVEYQGLAPLRAGRQRAPALRWSRRARSVAEATPQELGERK